MDKIQLIEVSTENRMYYVDPKTGQFYTTYVKLSARVIAFVLSFAFTFSITVFYVEIDNFYIPRSSTISNALLLAAWAAAAMIFHFWIKKRDRKKLAAQEPQPVSLEGKRKKQLLRRTKFNSIFVLVLIVVLLPAACISGYFFMRTSESRLFFITGLALLAFAALLHWTKYIFRRICIVHRLLKSE